MDDSNVVSERDHTNEIQEEGSFYHQLSDLVMGLDVDVDMDHTSSFTSNNPRMLCFGKPENEQPLVREKELQQIHHFASTFNDSGLTCNASRKTKKAKMVLEKPRTNKPEKASKQRLGERIAALQQLVSPYGKTDTASVLHEAMGYIGFLHDQVQMLCSPYLQCSLTSSSYSVSEKGDRRVEPPSKNLSSKGLCLVPVAFTMHVANCNGADFWSSAVGTNFSAFTK